MSASVARGAPEPDEAKPSRFELLCPEVTDEAQLLQYQAVDLWIRTLAARRKAENARLIALEHQWKLRKQELEDQVKAVLAQAKPPGKVSTLLASTYIMERKESVSLGDETALIGWLVEHDTMQGHPKPALERLVDAGILLMVPTMTEAGRAWAKSAILRRAKEGLDIPPGVVVTPESRIVATRPKASPVMDATEILARHQRALGELMLNEAIEENESEPDPEE